MLAKLRLDQTAAYEQAIAAYEIAKMLCAFIEGRKHILCIGAEQGEIQGWDDFVIQDGLSAFTHLQIKRQQTDFAPLNNCNRNGNAELTPLDRSMLSLANWISTYNPAVNTNIYHFRLCLPHENPVIKRNLEIRNFRDFMTLHINATTTTQGLYNLQHVANDGTAINLYNWLTTWCGFTNWDHIREALQRLQIITYRTEPDIDLDSINELSRVFREPANVLSLIKAYTQENSAYTASISPRQLLFELKDYLLDNQKTWTQISSVNGNWEISGIHDLENNLEVERPSKIIPLLWSNDRDRSFHINLLQGDSDFTPIHEGVFQLALHLHGNVNALCADWNSWKARIENKLGGTLGETENGLESLTIVGNNAPYNVTGGIAMNTNASRETFAKTMTAEMIKVTWQMVVTKVSWRISQMDISQSQELRDAVETKWNSWQEAINNDESILPTQLKKIVHPNAEGEEILGTLRIGPKTKLLIADALFTCLLISVSLDPSNSGIMRTEEGLRIGAIGLKWWSGPAGKARKVRRIDAEDAVNELVGKEPYDILVLSQSEQSQSEIYKQSIGASTNIHHSLAAGHSPQLLITRDRRFDSIINKGSLSDLSTYLRQKLEAHNESLTETINKSAS